MISKEELFRTRKLWDKNFGYKLHKKNKDGTEWWIVYTLSDKYFRYVSCSSMLMCYKICYTAYQIINNKKITFTIARRKAEDLTLKKSKFTSKSDRRRRNYRKVEPRFLDKREDVVIIPITKYKCPIHGIFEYNKEIKECIRCTNKVLKLRGN